MEQTESEHVILESQAKCDSEIMPSNDYNSKSQDEQQKQMEKTCTMDVANCPLIKEELSNLNAEKNIISAVLGQKPLIQSDEENSSPKENIESCKASMPAVEYREILDAEEKFPSISETQEIHQKCELLDQKLEQLTAVLAQKDNMIALYQRENALLEKEKQAFRKEKELATKEKESIVIKFAMKEKLLIDAKKEKEAVEKQLAEARKEIKNVTARFQAVSEEKSRITYIIDEKCNEVRKYQRECEKLKTDYNHLESKLKYHINKLNIETEAKMALEKKLEEERNAPNKPEDLEKLKVEHEANTILLRHQIELKTEQIETLTKECKKSNELIQDLREQLNQITLEKTEAIELFEALQIEHTSVQNALSDEILNSAKLRGQLEELQVLRTQNALNENKITSLNEKIEQLNETIEFNSHDLQELRSKELELLSTNKEVSESLVNLQNEMCLLKSKLQGIEAENELLKKGSAEYNIKYEELRQQLQKEIEQKSEERQLLTKHLSEKTKLYETTKMKLDNLLGDFEAANHKHATVVKELQREIQKHKKLAKQVTTNIPNDMQHSGAIEKFSNSIDYRHRQLNGGNHDVNSIDSDNSTQSRSISQNSICNQSYRRPSESSDVENTVTYKNTTTVSDNIKGPSKKHLIERILRLQQASAKQTEKIDFLENHTLSLVSELQKKSKVVQYYMLRDQAGALTSSKSDQHKSELSKYGNGVMSAIYGGIKSENKSMTLELSLEINKKLQAVLEDTLLKNITLKENLDVLGLEVDNLTRKLRFLESKE